VARAAAAGPAPRPELSALDIPQGAGHSNETVLFEATWRENGAPQTRRLVGRIRPSGRG